MNSPEIGVWGLPWEKHIEIYAPINLKFNSKTSSHAVFLAEAHSEKIKQKPYGFSSIWTCENPHQKHMVGNHSAI